MWVNENACGVEKNLLLEVLDRPRAVINIIGHVLNVVNLLRLKNPIRITSKLADGVVLNVEVKLLVKLENPNLLMKRIKY